MKDIKRDLIVSDIIRKKAAARQDLTPGEARLLEEWVSESEERRKFVARYGGEPDSNDFSRITGPFDREGVWKRISHRILGRRRRRRWLAAGVAASVMLMAFAGLRFFSPEALRPDRNNYPITFHDVPPATGRAVFQSYDGSTYYLENKDTTIMAAGTLLSVREGSIDYSEPGIGLQAEGVNTLKVPRGGFYSVTLDDGTLVHLNSDSELIFPVRFADGGREVTLEGEAVFEVARDQARPFVVHTGEFNVRVLGTVFTISAYPGEMNTSATLVSGKVEVYTKTSKGRVLSPGMQANLPRGASDFEVRGVNPREQMMWLEGVIVMNYSDLSSVMRMIARWYDVEVVYPEDFTGKHTFSGLLDRTVDLSVILNTLTRIGGPEFEVRDKCVYVK